MRRVLQSLAVVSAFALGLTAAAAPSSADDAPETYIVGGETFSLQNLRNYRHSLALEPETYWRFRPPAPPLPPLADLRRLGERHGAPPPDMHDPLLEPLAPDFDLKAAIHDSDPAIVAAALFVARKDAYAKADAAGLLAALPPNAASTPATLANARAMLAALKPSEPPWLTVAGPEACLIEPVLLYVDDLSPAIGTSETVDIETVAGARVASSLPLADAPHSVAPGRYKIRILNNAFYGDSAPFDCPAGAAVRAPVAVFPAI